MTASKIFYVIFGVACLVFIIACICLFFQTRKLKSDMEKRAEEVKKEEQEKEVRKNEAKENLNGGNNSDSVNASLDLLRNNTKN